VPQVAEGQEITLELLTDLSTSIRNVARDFLPGRDFTVSVRREPAGIVLRVPGATSKPMEAALYELAQGLKTVLDRIIPSLPLRYMVIGGSEAAGIQITVQPGATPVYGHVIKAKVERLIASEALRGKPRLVDALLKGDARL